VSVGGPFSLAYLSMVESVVSAKPRSLLPPQPASLSTLTYQANPTAQSANSLIKQPVNQPTSSGTIPPYLFHPIISSSPSAFNPLSDTGVAHPHRDSGKGKRKRKRKRKKEQLSCNSYRLFSLILSPSPFLPVTPYLQLCTILESRVHIRHIPPHICWALTIEYGFNHFPVLRANKHNP